MEDSGKIVASLKEFIKFNSGTAPLGIMWDTLKAFLRGVLIRQISHIKKQSQVEETIAGEKVREAEVRQKCGM